MAATSDRPRSSPRSGFDRRTPFRHARRRSRRDREPRSLRQRVAVRSAATAHAAATPTAAPALPTAAPSATTATPTGAALVGPLVAVLEEAFALWHEVAVGPPGAIAADDRFGQRAPSAEGGRDRADRLLRAAQACLGAFGGPAASPLAHQPAAAGENIAAATVIDPGLTARETEVLRLLADGRSDRQIADALYVSLRTVTSHVSSILAKLEVSSRTGAVARALRGGLV